MEPLVWEVPLTWVTPAEWLTDIENHGALGKMLLDMDPGFDMRRVAEPTAAELVSRTTTIFASTRLRGTLASALMNGRKYVIFTPMTG